jgi:BCCT family betaine/carnitine transporter
MERAVRMRKSNIDLVSIIVPLAGMIGLGLFFFVLPEESGMLLNSIRGFLGDDIGIFYIVFGIFTFAATMFMAFSKYGKIKLGGEGKPAYKPFAWGSMIFTATMGADIIFFSLIEWALYAPEEYVAALGDMQVWAPTFPLFHWGPIAWSIYIVLAVCFGFMLHVRGRTKQRFSQACRPILGDRVDRLPGKIIDLVAIFSILAAAGTTFSLATPLMTAALARVAGITPTVIFTIILLIVIALVYTVAVLTGMKGVSKLSDICIYMFAALLLYFLLFGGETRYILETGISSIGNLVQNFIVLSTWTDPLRESSFPQNWTIFYWSYWMAWSIATPFFLGMISKGRTIRETVIGAYMWGTAGTFCSFIILGNYSMAMQMRHGLDSVGAVIAGYDLSGIIISIVETLPLPTLALILIAVNMILFYSTLFDVVTIVVSKYSYKQIEKDTLPGKKLRIFWAVMFIVFPIALIFSENSMHNLQSVSIIAAFPIGIVITLIILSFFKDAGKYLGERD